MSRYLTCLVVLSSFGCATNTPLKIVPGASLPRFGEVKSLYVAEVTAEPNLEIGTERLNEFREEVRTRVDGVLGVATRERAHGNDQVVLDCHVTAYRPGSAFWRAMLIGLGSARFDVDYQLADGAGNAFAKGSVRKYWGWGGILGASKDIDDLVDEAASQIGEDLKAFREVSSSEQAP